MLALLNTRLWLYAGAALALVALTTWHVATERAERLGEIARAVADEQTKWVLEREKERARQAEVNRQAQEEGERAVARLEAQKTALEADLERMSHEAARDPEKGRLCLSPGAAERLQRIR